LKVPYEASANDESETTTVLPLSGPVDEDEDDLSSFVRPTTPDPNTDYSSSTVDPLPEGFDAGKLPDVNVTGDFIQGRASCGTHEK
jgi:hypothetical protein